MTVPDNVDVYGGLAVAVKNTNPTGGIPGSSIRRGVIRNRVKIG